MQAPRPTAGSPADGGVAEAQLDRTPPSTQASHAGDNPARAPTAGDRILANMSQSPVQAPAQSGPQAVHSVDARPSVDIGRPMDSFELQMQVAQIRETAGVAVGATQKSSQDVDTLLKSQ